MSGTAQLYSVGDEHHASSCVSFFASMRKRMQSMMQPCCVVPDNAKRVTKGRSKAKHRRIAERETDKAIAMIADGHTLTEAAHQLGVNPKTLQSRLNLRNLSVTKIRGEN